MTNISKNEDESGVRLVHPKNLMSMLFSKKFSLAQSLFLAIISLRLDPKLESLNFGTKQAGLTAVTSQLREATEENAFGELLKSGDGHLFS